MTRHRNDRTSMSEMGPTEKTSVRANVSILPSNPDIARRSRHVSNEPILQNSFCIDQDKFSEPYLRRSGDDWTDHEPIPQTAGCRFGVRQCEINDDSPAIWPEDSMTRFARLFPQRLDNYLGDDNDPT